VIVTIAPPSGGCAPVAYVISHARTRTLGAPARTLVPAAGALTARLGNLAAGVEYEATAVGTCADGTVTPPSAPVSFTPVPPAPSNVPPSAPSKVLWVTDNQNSNVYGCIASGTKLTDCTENDIIKPYGAAVVGSTAFVIADGYQSTWLTNTGIIACTVSGTTLTDCADSGATGFYNPRSIILSGSQAWVVNSGDGATDGYVSIFTVLGKTLTDPVHLPKFSASYPYTQPSDIAIFGATALVAFPTGFSMKSCTVSGCTQSGCTTLDPCNAPANFPSGTFATGIAIAGDTAWVTNAYGTILACSMSLYCTDSTVTSADVGGNLVGIAIWGSTAWVADNAGNVTVCTVSGATLTGCTDSGLGKSLDPSGPPPSIVAIAFSDS
jgi:hypothetical protein